MSIHEPQHEGRDGAALSDAWRLGPLALKNRLLKTATYEGMTAGGVPSDALTRHHVAIARGGVAMTTVAYCAVSDAGRTFSEQLMMSPAIVEPLLALTQAVHEAGAAVMLQLGHCGGFSKHRGSVQGVSRRSSMGPSARPNAYGVATGMPWVRAMVRDDLVAVRDEFVTAAKLASSAGFDAVELHLGHGYLLSQFLSPLTNRRRDAYGGDLERRAAFPREVVRAVLDAVGDRVAVLAKLNVDDGVRGGVTPQDARQTATMLEQDGIHGLVLSGGMVDRSAFFLLRGGRPLQEMAAVQKSPLERVAMRAFGRVLVPQVPFEPTYFLDGASAVRDACRLPLILVGGVTSQRDARAALERGIDGIALGRALLYDPAFAASLLRGEDARSGCTHCNLCVVTMDQPGGVHCPVAPQSLS